MLRELNRVIDYIEEHLTDEISLESVADYARVSDFHFRKVFFYLSGMTLSEYIKTEDCRKLIKIYWQENGLLMWLSSMVMSQQTDLPAHLRNGVGFCHRM